MPTDPLHPHVDEAHPDTIDHGKPYGCHSKPGVTGHWQRFQDGWTKDGRRQMRQVWVEFKTGTGCMHVGLSGLNKHNDPKCAGCSRRDTIEPSP